ncbi:peptide/nickel transport system substrate-binding protein [Bacillus oleivorans]|uniref:Peptide/nickel transport system substrate-binding protein n=1 Tax=Bacillus oleivorans TaxID=1448271 RepID=A0A285CS27_9BACI|nr:ABC transporter substrate-binding protein [Bacillus oleivorans]SNX70294.1 peptide/nickel transport system substrate-binding protein [Bacillus oleivorans]
MRKKSWGKWLSLLLIVMLVLAACNSNNTAEEPEEEEPDTEQPNNDDAGDDGTADEGETMDTLVFGRGGDSVALDPAIATDGESFKVTKNIYETLVEFGPQDTELYPGLATEWTPSDDGLTYTLKLREGVKFHDGTDFNADAVVYNFERWKAGSKEQFYYYNSQFSGIIDTVTAVDPYTVEFKLTRPLAPFLKNLAMSPFAIASPTAIEEHGDKFTENPVGTGPYIFQEWKRNDRITIVKNENYWDSEFPKLETIIFRSIPDNSARVNALMSGEVDLIDGVNYSDMPQIEANPDLQVFNRPSMNIAYLGLTATREPFNNKLVRQAINHAIDKEAIIAAFYEGAAQPAVNPMPPVIAGYNDEIAGYEYDPEKAKQLLAEAGFADGFEMELWAMPVPRPYMPNGQKVAEAIQANLADVGITATIVTYEWGVYLEKARLGEADAFLLGWTGDNGDPDNFLYVLLDKDSIGSNNYTYYSNDELHEILIQAQSETDPATREALYKQAQEIIHEDAPWVPLVHAEPALAGKKGIENFLPHPTGSDVLAAVTFKQ